MFTHCLRRIWDIIGGFKQQTIIWRLLITEYNRLKSLNSDLPNDQTELRQMTKQKSIGL